LGLDQGQRRIIALVGVGVLVHYLGWTVLWLAMIPVVGAALRLRKRDGALLDVAVAMVLAGGARALYLSFPMSGLLFVAGLITALPFLYVREFAEKPLALAIGRSARDAAAYVTLGIALVCLAQATLQGLFWRVSESTVYRIELDLIAFQRHVATTVGLGLGPLAIVLAILIVISVTWPHLPVMAQFSRLQRLGGRVLIVLTTLTSFTFFSANDVSSGRTLWLARIERTVAREATHAQGRLAAAALLERRIATFSPADARATRALLAAVQARGGTERLYRLVAEDLVRSMPSLYDHLASETPAVDVVGAIQDHAREHPQGDAGQLSIDDVRAALAETSRIRAGADAAGKAVAALLQTAIGDAIPSRVVGNFVNALLEAAGARIEKAVRIRVETFAEARDVLARELPAVKGGWEWPLLAESVDAEAIVAARVRDLDERDRADTKAREESERRAREHEGHEEAKPRFEAVP
jgi:hypothetical protein